jgi:hypothetical protein
LARPAWAEPFHPAWYGRGVRTRYLLTPPGDSRPSLLVDVVDAVDDAAIARAREAMFDRGCAHGLVIDPRRCVILRDTFESISSSSIERESELETAKLLNRPGGDLADRVERWLVALAGNWGEALPREDWVAPLLTDVVPAAAGSVVHRLAAA